MTEDLIFYTNPMSRGQIARWMLEEVGQPYHTEVLQYASSMKAPAYLAINPMGKVPAIRHGQVVVSETPAICAYLADAFPEAGLAPPPGDPARGPYYRWLFFGAGPLEAATSNRAAKLDAGEQMSRMMGYGTYDIAATVIEAAVEAALDGPGYLTAERFTAADLYVGSQLGFCMRFGMLERRPAFERFVAKLDERPARQRAQAIDEALIAQMQKA
jgi:glutathione S-transferase